MSVHEKLDALNIRLRHAAKKNKKGKKTAANTQASPQPQEREQTCKIGATRLTYATRKHGMLI
jgi:hypothetical protein